VGEEGRGGEGPGGAGVVPASFYLGIGEDMAVEDRPENNRSESTWKNSVSEG
jgi:hypothetical protein